MTGTQDRHPIAAIDFGWFRSHLLDDILPHWLEAACLDRDVFPPRLDRYWQPQHQQVCTLVSQSRLTYNMAVGYELTEDERYAEAVERGVRGLREAFCDDSDAGGWVWACAPDGSVVDDSKDSYGHAFLIFGLAHAFHATGDTLALDMIPGALLNTAHHFLDEEIGIIPRLDREFLYRIDEAHPVNSQNPMMHLFEAMLAAPADDDSMREIAETVAAQLFVDGPWRPGAGLPELYDLNWAPLSTRDGGRIDLGHQFEWAYLLSAAEILNYAEECIDIGSDLLDYGLRVGYDPEEGGIFSDASLEGEVIDPRKGWWQQCEAARAMMHYAVVRGRDDLWEPLANTIRYFQTNLIDPEYGGWYANDRLDKGNEWKVDYHVVAMCEEAILLGEAIEG